jgi:hypothetical protein
MNTVILHSLTSFSHQFELFITMFVVINIIDRICKTKLNRRRLAFNLAVSVAWAFTTFGFFFPVH